MNTRAKKRQQETRRTRKHNQQKKKKTFSLADDCETTVRAGRRSENNRSDRAMAIRRGSWPSELSILEEVNYAF